MGTNGAHHGEVSLRQVLVEREAVASSSLVGSGGQDPIGELLLVQEAHGPELTVEEPGAGQDCRAYQLPCRCPAPPRWSEAR